MSHAGVKRQGSLQWRECKVCQIISGDMFVVEPKGVSNLWVVSLNNIRAPRMPAHGSDKKGEFHCFDSWMWLRDQIRRQLIEIPGQVTPRPDAKRTHTQFGDLPIVHTHVRLTGKDVYGKDLPRRDLARADLAELAVKDGMVKVQTRNPEEGVHGFMQKLVALEAEAKAKKLGVWGESDWFKNHPGKYTDEEILKQGVFEKAVVDGIGFDGTMLKLILLPKHTRVGLKLAGVTGPPKGSMEGEQRADDSIREIRKGLVHMKVDVRICQPWMKKNVADSLPRFIGTLVGPADGTTRTLCQKGCVRYYRQTANLCPTADQYIRLEIEARKQGLGIWKGSTYEPKPVSDFEGVCTGIVGTHALVLTRGQEHKTFYIAGLRVPFYYDVTDCELWAWETRMFLAKQFINQRMRAEVTIAYEDRNYAVLHTDHDTVQAELLRNGWAQLDDHCLGPKHTDWDHWAGLHKEAQEKGLGRFSKNEVALNLREFKSLTSEKGAQDLPAFFKKFEKKQLSGIAVAIDAIPRFTVVFPQEKVIASVTVAHLQRLGRGHKYENQLKNYVTTNYLHRSVTVTPVDRGSEKISFVAQVQTTLSNGRQVDVAEDLVGQGFIRCNKFIDNDCQELRKLLKLEEQARNAHTGIWKDRTLCKHHFTYGQVEMVKVVSVWDPITVGIQRMSKEMDELTAGLRDLDRKEPIKEVVVGECVLLQRRIEGSESLVRARICKRAPRSDQQRAAERVLVKLIDFSEQPIMVPINSLYQMPPQFADIEPQGRTVVLGCCEPFKDPKIGENCIAQLWTACKDAKLYLHLMYKDDRAHVLLTDNEPVNSGSLNRYLIDQGLLNFVEHNVYHQFDEVVSLLRQAAHEKPPST